jgi:hypothetical protein
LERTSLILSLQNILSRNLERKINVNDMKAIKEDRVSFLLEMNEDLALAGQVSKEAIDHLTRQIDRLREAGATVFLSASEAAFFSARLAARIKENSHG